MDFLHSNMNQTVLNLKDISISFVHIFLNITKLLRKNRISQIDFAVIVSDHFEAKLVPRIERGLVCLCLKCALTSVLLRDGDQLPFCLPVFLPFTHFESLNGFSTLTGGHTHVHCVLLVD